MAKKKVSLNRSWDRPVTRLGFSNDPFMGHGFGFEDRMESLNNLEQGDIQALDIPMVDIEALAEKGLDASDNQLNEDTNLEDEPSSISELALELESLYVLAPEDTDDLSLEDLETIWEHREELCGSIEVAAEVLALLEKAKSNLESFKGWKGYINHPAIRRLQGKLPSLRDIEFIDGLDERDFNKSDDIDPYRALTKTDVEKLNASEVQEAWDGRPYSFGSISAACEALSLLRMHQGTDAIRRPWMAFINHDSIRQLYDYLDDDTKEDVGPPEDFVILFKTDNRQKISSKVTVREGQGNFREQLIREYGCRCCISGCEEGAVIEAAHITPYKGKQTNILENGLLMRVDLHRLFDKHLIAIEAASLTVRVASSVTDEYYRSLHGMKLKCRVRRKTRQFLQEHYNQFLTLGSSQN